MTNWFSRDVRRGRSVHQAKERLKLVLIHDRTNITPETLQKLKEELLVVISHHVDIDSDAVKIRITQSGREQKLVADIPLKTSYIRRKY